MNVDMKSVANGKEDDYDPLEHRQVAKPNSDIRSTANLIKASLGSGLLAVPLAFANAGWGVGIVGTLIIGFICGHCVHILVSVSRACCKKERKPLLDYAETCRAAFDNGPKWARKFGTTAKTVIFAMEGIGVVMPVENTMKKPQHFLGCPSVLVVSMTIIAFLYSTLGLFGYFRFGDVLRGSITLNLPMDDWPAICAKVFISLSIFLTYPLQFFVVIDIFNKYTEPHISERYKNTTQIISRSVGVCICVGIGIALPMLEQIINFVGAFFYSILGLLIPSAIETVFRWDDLGRYNWVLWKNLVIFLIGAGALVSGCTVAIMDMIEITNSPTV
ncbi:unnamed protein product [Plutella xylostella]|uniref:(diamondback moth) hypothetical protein n=1 Tax=Plutella xylostella TaxID=51655 RepID=A0A8S4D6W7_PLUXY|nr:unnamed protein product [Plutella xylostella]